MEPIPYSTLQKHLSEFATGGSSAMCAAARAATYTGRTRPRSVRRSPLASEGAESSAARSGPLPAQL